MTVYWTLTESVSGDHHTFEKNPDVTGGAGSVGYDANVGEAFVDDQGRPWMVRTQDHNQTSGFQLTTLTKAAYDALRDWYRRGLVLVLTDDLGRSMHIFMTELDLKRVRNARVAWMHVATASYLVLSMSGG